MSRVAVAAIAVGLGLALSGSALSQTPSFDTEAVRQKIRHCWNTAAAKAPTIVSITVKMDRDARPLQAIPGDKTSYDGDPNYRIAADAALRAIMNPRCQPWPLPLDKYEVWQTLTFTFDSRDF